MTKDFIDAAKATPKKCGFFNHCFHDLPATTVTVGHGRFGVITETRQSDVQECCKCEVRRNMSGGF